MRCWSTRWCGGPPLVCAFLLAAIPAWGAGRGAAGAGPTEPSRTPTPEAPTSSGNTDAQAGSVNTDAATGSGNTEAQAGSGNTEAHAGSGNGGGIDWLFVSGVALATVAVGFGVTYGVAVARVNALEGDAEFQSYRASVPASMDSCEAARDGTPIEGTTAAQAAHVVDVCDEAHTMETLEAVSVPLGIVSGLTAAVLILMSDTVAAPPRRTATGWRLDPILGPEGAGAALRLRF